MRIAPITTNETCNHRCAFCRARRPVERPEIAGAAAIRARIDRAIEAGARELVITGGEPTLRRDLPAIVAYAARGGARVILETNAAALEGPTIERLRAAGLDTARVHLPAWGDDADRITGDVGGFARTLRAIRALHAAGVRVEGAIPLSREGLAGVAAIPAAIRAEGLPIAGLWALVVTATPAASAPPSVAASGAALEALAAAANAAGIRLQLAPQILLPPCLFEHPAKVAHLYALSPGGRDRPGYLRQEACEGCAAGDRCPGIPAEALAHEPDLKARPIQGDRMRRRLSVIASVDAQIERELVTTDIARRPDGVRHKMTTVRVLLRCNQTCAFCFVSTHLPGAADARVEAAIREAARDGGKVILSGGEPTLHPRIVDFAALARAEGASEIELQTNATRLGDGDLAERLAAAGVDWAFVSLHGVCAATSDAITGAPGTFERTLLGLDALARTSIAVRVNFVICRANYTELPAYIDMVADRWPRAGVTVSFVGPSTDLVPHNRELIPSYSEVLPAIAEAVARADARGVEVSGFESMCGLPLCLAPAGLERHMRMAAIPEGFDMGEFVKAAACEGCALEPRCFGIRRRYAELYGTGELRTIPAEAIARADEG